MLYKGNFTSKRNNTFKKVVEGKQYFCKISLSKCFNSLCDYFIEDFMNHTIFSVTFDSIFFYHF